MKKKSGKKGLYKRFLNQVLESKRYFLFAITLFLVAFILGFLYPYIFREEILNFMRELVLMFEGKGFLETFLAIFFNNLQASFFALFLGIGFAIVPIFLTIINGYVIGFVLRLVAELQGIGEFWRLLPHGIFEIPAIILSIGFGIRLGTRVIKRKDIKRDLKNAFKFFLGVIVPLLLIAAIIETIAIFFFP